MDMKELIVSSKYDGKKLNNFLLDTFDGLSLNFLYKALRKKDIRINDVRVNRNVVVHTGDQVKVFISDEQLEKANCSITNVSQNFAPDIIYEDNNICIINKPAGIEVVGENSLTSLLVKYYSSLKLSKSALAECENFNFHQDEAGLYNNPANTSNKEIFIKPCHRLDRNTTGLVLFAKNETVLEILLQKFKNHEIEKHYLATVYGIPTKKQATLTAYLFKDAKKSLVYISDTPKKGYEKIITSYQVIKENKKENTSILDVNLHTGKTHQIRAHLAHIGYPILGDGKYGNNVVNKKFGFKTQQLTSYSLAFNFKSESGILSYLNGKMLVV